MTRTGPRKKVDADFWAARLRVAQGYREAARREFILANEGENCTPVVSQAVLAAIAYADAITARKERVINQQDHATLARLVRDVLGNALPDAQERRLRKLVGRKDAVHYGVSVVSYEDTRRVVDDLDAFGTWVEDLLR